MADFSCLVVEDSPMMRQLIVYALARIKNLTVTEADNGVAGLKKLASERYDLVITDINMPLMDGLKLISALRKDPGNGQVPIIVISTESAEPDIEKAIALGADAYLVKPVQSPQVLATVKQLLGRE